MDKKSSWALGVSIANLLILVIGGSVGFFLISLPARFDESRLADLEAKTRAIAIQQSAFESRAKAANATIAEHEANQIRRPAVQVTPKIEQFGSIEDIREIRLSLLLANVGNADSTIRKISVHVEDGAPTKQVAEILTRTREYYHRRMEYYRQPTEADPSPVEQAEFLDPIPSAEPAATDGLFNDTGLKPIQRDDNCPHGRVFAIGANSPDVKWQAIENATQTLDRQQLLRPQQSATHHFTFLLTEYPMQHNRQWIRFRITVDQELGERQEYALLVSGLPLSPCSDARTVYKCCSQSEPCVWQPDAPLMPINSQ